MQKRVSNWEGTMPKQSAPVDVREPTWGGRCEGYREGRSVKTPILVFGALDRQFEGGKINRL